MSPSRRPLPPRVPNIIAVYAAMHPAERPLEAVKNKGAAFKSLADTWADTTTPHGQLVLTVLAGLAEFERALILARTTGGRIRDQAAGKKFGRKPKLTTFQEIEIVSPPGRR